MRETHTFIDVQTKNFLPKTLSKNQSKLPQHPHITQRTTSLRLNIFCCFVFLKILCEFFKHEELLIFGRNNVRKMENVRERVKKREKERTIRIRRLIKELVK